MRKFIHNYMDQIPFTGFPENPEKKNKEEQVRILIERHNFLVDQVAFLEKEFLKKDEMLYEFKKTLNEDLIYQKEKLEQNKELLRLVLKLKNEIGGEFKQIIKTPLFEKLKKRVDSLEYEEYVHREELKRKLI